MAISQIKFSTIDLDFVKKYLRVDSDFTDDDIEIQLFIDSSKSWVREHTGMTDEQLDEIDYATILTLKYASDFYSDRTAKSNKKLIHDPVLDMLLSKVRTYNLGGE